MTLDYQEGKYARVLILTVFCGCPRTHKEQLNKVRNEFGWTFRYAKRRNYHKSKQYHAERRAIQGDWWWFWDKRERRDNQHRISLAPRAVMQMQKRLIARRPREAVSTMPP